LNAANQAIREEENRKNQQSQQRNREYYGGHAASSSQDSLQLLKTRIRSYSNNGAPRQ